MDDGAADRGRPKRRASRSLEEVLVEGRVAPTRASSAVRASNTTVVFEGSAAAGELVNVLIEGATSTTLRGVEHAAVAA